MYSLKAWYVSSIMHSFLATDLFLTVRALKISLPLQGKCCCATCCYWRGPCWQLAHQWSSVFPWATSGITIANCIFQLLGQRFFVQEAYQVVLLGSTSVTNWRVQEWVKGDLNAMLESQPRWALGWQGPAEPFPHCTRVTSGKGVLALRIWLSL